ncbi:MULTISPECIES: biotin--[acetyl-CoA-carboxylase] ligase [unclassified Polaribacter]|uniref:biotin--[acetyl-CoA-carboxylase] ligase n=1 Tax=unclassified Polaribacter TaxID=196858 RepID=UPI0011BD87A2|nr:MULTISPECIES: biotin--[acetyl-CoA-carboxylase] ligase [unclassified Polaribacter]TXD54417.1 biotin--[acetyl-CoA-carboxylase] ligase [Polaribacter sp. IC063]TXD60330.1 biotin--[acetyl-CoA-carboxylase] ligase [Polaribacter sp. IC066]
MKLIKLNAIASTSSFLKELSQNSVLENYTVVVTKEQTNGRGQQANSWVSEPSKNLTMSVFINGFNLEIINQKYLNFAISLAIFDVLYTKEIGKLSIKWPNDILSANKKICGILIENSIRSNDIYASIVGIGLNVNQIKFPDFLENASSLKKITQNNYDLDSLLFEIIAQIKKRVKLVKAKKYTELENDYLNVLYKKNIPTMFKDSTDVLFMGMITGISVEGNLQVELADETTKEFRIKEISIA